MTIYILSDFNNYYNRIVKKEASLADYITKYDVEYSLTNVNFVPGNGINTQHVLGSGVTNYSGKGDYLIVADASGNIVSRWFIIDSERNRAGQYTVTLHRDLVVDYYEDIKNAPMYIEKAILNDNDPLIYNNEQLAVNQIKTSQLLLKDKTNSAWLVGYLSAKPQEPVINFDATINVDYDGAFESLESWELYNFSNKTSSKVRGITNLTSKTLSMNIKHFSSDYYDKYTFSLMNPGRPFYTEKYSSITKRAEFYYANGVNASYNLAESIYSKLLQNSSTVGSVVNSLEASFVRQNVYEKYNGKVFKDLTSGKYYNVTINLLSSLTITTPIEPTGNSDVRLVECFGTPSSSVGPIYYFDNRISRALNLTTQAFNGFELDSYGQEFEVVLDEIEVVVNSGSIPNTTKVAKDAPYKVFAMPYRLDKEFTFYINDAKYTMSKEQSMSIMTKLVTDYSESNVLYDAQILPYCPVTKFINENGHFDLNNITSVSGASPEGVDYVLVKDADQNINGFIAFCDYSSFTTQLNYTRSLTNKKINNECDKYRLCSPNFNGAFEFNLAKNGGLSGFIVSCTYKPYQPYIKVAPIFSELYGGNFTDPRGLICGGEFGLPLLSDKWSTYEINNKNYLNSFNRQIENMELAQDIQRKQEYWSIGAGVLSGAAGGALAGNSIAPGMGAGIGAVAGAAVSLAGGLQDVYYSNQLRNEALDYTKDQFNYSLENIQALPYSLSRVSSLTNDNTIYPVLEYYTCTNKEKVAVANKIAYNGMTVMAIGTINDYIGNSWSYTYTDEATGTNKTITDKGYIKGKLIRSDSIDEDFKILNAIAEELNKGVFMK